MVYSQKPITEWAAEDRPREKMIQKGLGSLTEAELVATLLATGTYELSAIELARTVIDHFGGLHALSRASIAELMQVKGIGVAKATSIMSAFELGRRKMATEHRPIRFETSNSLVHYLIPKIGDLPYEVFYIIYLDRQNQLIGEKEVFRGGVSNVTVDGRYLFKQAINNMASSVVVCHNHPSGRAIPSKTDDQLTQHLVGISEIVGISLLDHLIVTHKGWYSYADQGMLEGMVRRVDKALQASKSHQVEANEQSSFAKGGQPLSKK